MASNEMTSQTAARLKVNNTCSQEAMQHRVNVAIGDAHVQTNQAM